LTHEEAPENHTAATVLHESSQSSR